MAWQHGTYPFLEKPATWPLLIRRSKRAFRFLNFAAFARHELPERLHFPSPALVGVVKCSLRFSIREQIMNFYQRREICIATIIAIELWLGSDFGACLAQDTAQRPRAGLSVWDTSKPSAQKLAPESVDEKNGWKPIGSSEASHTFQGD